MSIQLNSGFLERAQLAADIIKNTPGITGKELREKMNVPRRSLFGVLRFLEEEKHILKTRSLKDARMFKYYPVN